MVRRSYQPPSSTGARTCPNKNSLHLEGYKAPPRYGSATGRQPSCSWRSKAS
jgi:hypothetical protein